MTAIGVLQLRDEGRVDLDEPVNRYLKSFTVEPPATEDEDFGGSGRKGNASWLMFYGSSRRSGWFCMTFRSV